MPVFIHEEKDVATFRMITGQFCVNGNAKQAEIARAFGVTEISVKRAVKLYREKGPSGFYAPRPSRGAAVLIEPVVAEIEEFLAAGLREADIAERMGLKRDTLRKAIRAGRVRAPVKKKETLAQGTALVPSTKSARAEVDCAAPMGRGATATLERLAASLGR